MISLTVNGSQRMLNEDTPLPALLDLLNVDLRRVAVAVNGEVVPKASHASVTLRDGDVVEIVRMVGGGQY